MNIWNKITTFLLQILWIIILTPCLIVVSILISVRWFHKNLNFLGYILLALLAIISIYSVIITNQATIFQVTARTQMRERLKIQEQMDEMKEFYNRNFEIIKNLR